MLTYFQYLVCSPLKCTHEILTVIHKKFLNFQVVQGISFYFPIDHKMNEILFQFGAFFALFRIKFESISVTFFVFDLYKTI